MLFPVRRGSVLFFSVASAELEGNLKRVQEELLLIAPDRTQWCELKSSISARRGLLGAVRFARNLARAETIVIDDYVPELSWLTLRSRQHLVQLWHAGGAFKKFGHSRFGLPGGPSEASRIHKGYTAALVSAKKLKPLYAEAFKMSATRVHSLGVPRYDQYFDNDWVQQAQGRINQEFDVDPQAKVVLYAPTFRGNGQRSASFNQEVDWLNSLAANHVVITRMHKFVGGLRGQSPKVIDATHYPAAEDLVARADVLITDFSSILFEFALLAKPTVLFVPDAEEYSTTRGLFFPIDHYAYGPVCHTPEELLQAVENPQIDEQKLASVRDFHLSGCDGHSTRRVVEQLILEHT